MNQHRHVEAGHLQAVGHAAFIAEVGERDDDAVDGFPVPLEEIGALLGVFPRFHCAELGVFVAQNDNLIPELRLKLCRHFSHRRHTR